MLNLQEITKFRAAKPGTGLHLESDKRRVVRLLLNTAEPCQLQLESSGKIQFLANVDGYEELSFVADGTVTIWPDSDGEIWWWSPEMETEAVLIEKAVSFARIANRRERNPTLERVMRKGQENMERRMRFFAEQMTASVNGTVAALRAENEALKKEAKPNGKSKAKAPAPAKPAAVSANPAGDEESPADDDGGTDGEN